MNILFITFLCVGFMVSEIPRVSLFGHFPLVELEFKLVFHKELWESPRLPTPS